MADPTELEESETEEGQAPARTNWRKELTAERDEAKNELAAVKQELALTQAGLSNLSPKQVKALLATHDGDLTGDALKATAAELGFGGPAPEVEQVETQDPQVQAELDTMSQFANTPVQHSAPPQAYDEVVKASQEFEGSHEDWVNHLLRNADVLDPGPVR